MGIHPPRDQVLSCTTITSVFLNPFRLRSGMLFCLLKSQLKKGEEMAAKITVNNSGPLRVEGDFEICDTQGSAFGLAGRTTISLCRCGHSANNPFCDGSHKATGFQDTQVARELPPPKPKL